MRIIRSPLRVSLFGGGTDLPEYYSQHGATIISMAISRYIYLVHNPRPTGGYRISYSKTEELGTLTTAKHTLVRQAALDYGELDPCTISIISDVPKGTGLGSSSSLSVALVQLFRKREIGHRRGLARAAYELEHQASNCGIQDHLPPVHGGFNVYSISNDGAVATKPAPASIAKFVDKYGLLLYTGQSRDADAILTTWKKSTSDLDKIRDLAEYVARDLENLSLYDFAQLTNATWQLKKQIGGVANEALNRQYLKAITNGAIGGKLLGAGGGGCWFFLALPENRQRVIDATGLVEIPFRIERAGVGDRYY